MTIGRRLASLRRLTTRSAAVGFAVLLSGCAGFHSMPPPNYSTVAAANPRLIKLIFDQNGNLYPQSPDPSGIALPEQAPNRNAEFDLAKHYSAKGIAYDGGALLRAAAADIREALSRAPNARLVFLIKGFNNSYRENDDEYAWVRQRIFDYNPSGNFIFVQVYWDALYKGKRTAPAPLAYFGEAMSYSNMAGMCGLRPLLELLPDGTRTTFLTHSRGAAVALAAISDPLFDPKIRLACELPPLRPGKLADAALVAFAPAIGDGHMRETDGRTDLDMYSNLAGFYVGFAENDFATSKTHFGIRLGGYRAGDTRLGSEPAYFDLIAGGSGGRLQREVFTQTEHDWEAYVAQDQQTRCLFWAGRLIDTRPEGCSVRRDPSIQGASASKTLSSRQ